MSFQPNQPVNINIDFGQEPPSIDMAAFNNPTYDSMPAYPSSFGGDSFGQGQSQGPMQSLETQLNAVMSEMHKLEQELQQMEADLQNGGSHDGESKYASASGASTGDPHLSFDGSSAGNTTDKKWDDMGSHADLLDANGSFRGGYQVSTTATGLNSNGVAYNKSATISTGNDRDTVTMGPNGQVMVLQNGQNLDLQKGQSITLGSGAVVSEAQDGSITVKDKNAQGADISTTMKWNGQGVDVSFDSQHAYLGGDLVDQNKGVMA